MIIGMRRVASQAALATLVCLVAMLVGAAAASEDCPRGALDTRYCDRAGDLVADPPTDPAQWRDPAQLTFAYTPVEDPATYAEIWAEFLEHLEAVTGKSILFFTVESYAAQVETMRAGRLHVAGISTGAVPMAVNQAGFVPFTLMGRLDGEYGYRMMIISHVDSDIEELADLRGRQVAFTSPTSNSGYKAPVALLKAELDMDPDVDYEPAFSGRHDNSVFGVYNMDYEAAAIADSMLYRLADQGLIDPEQIRVVYQSDPFPPTAYGYAHDLHPELVEKIKEAFFTFDWEGTRFQQEFAASEEEMFIPITYAEQWQVVRTVEEQLEAMGLD
jgi:phosphonate transport system substrate-binding protein